MYRSVNIGLQIRHFRMLKGWSQENLALRAGINPAFLGHLERSLKQPTVTTLEKIAKALDIPLSELFDSDIMERDANQQAIDRIVYQVKDLSAEQILKISNIVKEIVSYGKESN